MSEPKIEPRHKLVLRLLLISAFVVILNETLMGVAIPRLMVSFHVPASSAQWLTTAFLLTMATVIPVTGFMLQRLNTRPIFMLAMSLFSLGTLAATLAPNLHFLVAARVIQASGTAIMMPLLMTSVMMLVPLELRGRTMGNISIVISVAPAIGPTISGVILNYLHWRWLLILILPIALSALWLGTRRIENVTTPRYTPLDVLSVFLAGLAFGGLVYGISTVGSDTAPGALPTWIPLVVGAVCMVAFILRQLALQRGKGALLDLRTFRSPNFAVCVSLMALLMGALFGVIIVLPLYLQNVLSLSTLQTGLLLLPGGLLMGLLAPRVGRLYDRIGPRPLVITGIFIVSTVLWAMTLLGTKTPVAYILTGHVIMSIGFACLFTPLYTTSLSSVPPMLYSHGSATLSSIQQVAGASGVALLIALFSSHSARLAAQGVAPLEALNSGIRAAFLTAASLSLVALVGMFFVQRPRPIGVPASGS
jgi:DHA2 family lincomycin resistance protein-like MFS transporter